jgi:hypothetical protein
MLEPFLVVGGSPRGQSAWLMEVEAVTVRLDPELVRQAVSLLHAWSPYHDWPRGLPESLRTLGRTRPTHQFESRDHPVALTEPDAACLTTEPAHLSYQSVL